MSDLISTDNPFSLSTQASLRLILGAMIPASSTRPGADDELIFADVLATARPHVEVIQAVIAELENTDMQALSESRSPAVRALVGFVVQCYYRDERVMATLDMEPRAPHPLGYDLQQGDWSKLEPVRQRGEIYRRVD